MSQKTILTPLNHPNFLLRKSVNSSSITSDFRLISQTPTGGFTGGLRGGVGGGVRGGLWEVK